MRGPDGSRKVFPPPAPGPAGCCRTEGTCGVALCKGLRENAGALQGKAGVSCVNLMLDGLLWSQAGENSCPFVVQ